MVPIAKPLSTVAVLGAGYMGSAITYPLAENGVGVRLWGTWLDDGIIDSCKSGNHPKLKKKLPEAVSLFYSKEIGWAVRDVDAVFIAVTSEGFIPVFQVLLDTLERACPVFTLTKGFLRQGELLRKGTVLDRSTVSSNGAKILRISEGAEEMFRSRFQSEQFAWASVGGPVKAAELSLKIPSATVYGVNAAYLRETAESFSTGYYRVEISGDVRGVELSSAFKNAYAVAIGICDGLYEQRLPGLYHNFRGIMFTQAVKEMSIIVSRAGGQPGTVYGLAGVGDLHVTGSSGRNRRLGELIGSGMTAEDAYRFMLNEGEVAEGYTALELGTEYIRELDPGLLQGLPLLGMLHRVIFGGRALDKELDEFVHDYRG